MRSLVYAITFMLMGASHVLAPTLWESTLSTTAREPLLWSNVHALHVESWGGEKNTGFDSTKALMTYLDESFEGHPHLQKTLHSLVNTHPHLDHTGGVKPVRESYRFVNELDSGIRN